MRRSWSQAFFGLGAVVLLSGATAAAGRPGAGAKAGSAGPDFGVYLQLLRAPAGSFEQVVAAVGPAIQRMGWQSLASYDAGNGGCKYRAKVFVLDVPSYTKAVLARGVRAAFALPLRLAVYEDELGVHLAAANPQSLARTVVAETGFEAPPAALVQELQQLTASGFPGTPVLEQYGQLRSRGLIEKTMGIVAGGPFPTKLETVTSMRAESAAELADRIAARARTASGRWGLRLLYQVKLPGYDAVLLGLSGAPMEARAFSIVGAGADARRKEYACPGLDHAAAFPIEVLLVREGADVKALLIDEMFRMKLYFEDAGRIKFAMNMQMPGSIEDELRDLLEEVVY